MFAHIALTDMPRRARVCVENNRRRLQICNRARERQRLKFQAAQEVRGAPVHAEGNELDELQLQHPAHPSIPERDDMIEDEHMIEDEYIRLPAPHHLGGMKNRFPHCGARYLQEECTTQRIFTKCCFQGKVSLPQIELPSRNGMELFGGNTAELCHFLENILHYNATMSMASWNATLSEHAGRGPRVVTIHGQAYHLTAAQEAPEGQPPQYAQLYILDTNDALQQRVTIPVMRIYEPMSASFSRTS